MAQNLYSHPGSGRIFGGYSNPLPRQNRHPRREQIIISVSALSAYAYGVWQYGTGTLAGTLLFMGLTIAQVLHTLSFRSERSRWWQTERLPGNPYVTGAIALAITLQLLPMLVPGLMNLLSLAPLSAVD